MRVRHHHEGKVYEIEFPAGSRVYRCRTLEGSIIWVQDASGGGDHFVPDWPGELMIQLARKGSHGLRLISERPARPRSCRTDEGPVSHRRRTGGQAATISCQADSRSRVSHRGRSPSGGFWSRSAMSSN